MQHPVRSRLLFDLIGTAARLGLTAVWFLSGFAKAADPRQTLVAVRGYQILSDDLARTVAAVLPYLEIALGLLLLLGMVTRYAALVSGLLLLVFIAGVISAAARGLSIDCGCFGGGGQVSAGNTAYTQEILRDTGFLVLAVWLVVRPRSWLAVDSLALRTRDPQFEADDDEVLPDESEELGDGRTSAPGDGRSSSRRARRHP